MKAQPTRGKWQPKRIQEKAKQSTCWGVTVEGIRGDINVALVYPAYMSWSKKRTRRDHYEEKANAYLIAQAKNMARAILKLQEAYEKADEDVIEQAWEYAESVLEAAKVPE